MLASLARAALRQQLAHYRRLQASICLAFLVTSELPVSTHTRRAASPPLREDVATKQLPISGRQSGSKGKDGSANACTAVPCAKACRFARHRSLPNARTTKSALRRCHTMRYTMRMRLTYDIGPRPTGRHSRSASSASIPAAPTNSVPPSE